MARRYENILETVGRTPVVKVAKLAPPGVELFVKLEAFNPLGSITGVLIGQHFIFSGTELTPDQVTALRFDLYRHHSQVERSS